jgi:hypothetical protein
MRDLAEFFMIHATRNVLVGCRPDDLSTFDAHIAAAWLG